MIEFEKPRFKHDCARCQFVGRFDHIGSWYPQMERDGYVCERVNADGEPYGSVILRYGNEGHENISTPLGLSSKLEPYKQVLKLKLTLEGKQP